MCFLPRSSIRIKITSNHSVKQICNIAEVLSQIVEGQRCIRKRDSGFLHRLSNYIAPSIIIASEDHDNRGGSLWGKIWGRRGWRWPMYCKSCCNTIWERHRAVICERNSADTFCHLSTMHERTWQTDRETDQGTVTSIAVGKNACQRCRLINTEAWFIKWLEMNI